MTAPVMVAVSVLDGSVTAIVMVLLRLGVLTLPVMNVMVVTVLMNVVFVTAVVLPMATATATEIQMTAAEFAVAIIPVVAGVVI